MRRRSPATLGESPDALTTYFPGGAAPGAGDVFRNPNLGRVYEAIARDGPRAFYEGDVAGKIVAYSDQVGGLFSRTDVSDEASVRAAVDAAAVAGPPLRVAVSCAGIGWAARTVSRDGTPHDLASYQKRNTAALQARKESTTQLRDVEKKLASGHSQEATDLLKKVAANRDLALEPPRLTVEGTAENLQEKHGAPAFSGEQALPGKLGLTSLPY